MPHVASQLQQALDDAVLLERVYLYRLFQSVFGAEPNRAQLEVVFSDLTAASLEPFADEADMASLAQMGERFAEDPARFEDALCAEYTRAFVGPAELPAPPWESVYASKDRLLFQETTLAVRRCYVEHDCIPAGYPHVADDHISLELDFLAKLAERMMEAAEAQDGARAERLAQAQGRFLANHLLAWVGDFAGQVDAGRAPYYACLARLTARFAEHDGAWLAAVGA